MGFLKTWQMVSKSVPRDRKWKLPVAKRLSQETSIAFFPFYSLGQINKKSLPRFKDTGYRDYFLVEEVSDL